MRKDKFTNHKLTNLLHTTLLIGGMLVLLAALGLSLAGTNGLIWAIVAGMLFLIFSRQVSPNFLLRMSGAKYLSKQEAPGLYQLVQELAHRAKLPAPPRLYYIPSPILNAFTVGRTEQAALGMTDGLLRNLNNRELSGVLAHEISHIRNNDTRVLQFAAAISRITSLFSTFGQFLLFINLPLLLIGRALISWPAILLLIAAPTLSGLLQLALSRTREYEADLGAADLTGDPEGLASALVKMENYQDNFFTRLFTRRSREQDSSLFRTHPHTQERIGRLMALKVEKRTPIDLPFEIVPTNPGQLRRNPRRLRWFYIKT
jgi:heat shock protein HtpX